MSTTRARRAPTWSRERTPMPARPRRADLPPPTLRDLAREAEALVGRGDAKLARGIEIVRELVRDGSQPDRLLPLHRDRRIRGGAQEALLAPRTSATRSHRRGGDRGARRRRARSARATSSGARAAGPRRDRLPVEGINLQGASTRSSTTTCPGTRPATSSARAASTATSSRRPKSRSSPSTASTTRSTGSSSPSCCGSIGRSATHSASPSPCPIDSNAVLEAILEGLLLRGRRATTPTVDQLELFERTFSARRRPCSTRNGTAPSNANGDPEPSSPRRRSTTARSTRGDRRARGRRLGRRRGAVRARRRSCATARPSTDERRPRCRPGDLTSRALRDVAASVDRHGSGASGPVRGPAEDGSPARPHPPDRRGPGSLPDGYRARPRGRAARRSGGVIRTGSVDRPHDRAPAPTPLRPDVVAGWRTAARGGGSPRRVRGAYEAPAWLDDDAGRGARRRRAADVVPAARASCDANSNASPPASRA